MDFSAWLDGVYANVCADLDALPQWKKDAMARDEAYLAECSYRDSAKIHYGQFAGIGE